MHRTASIVFAASLATTAAAHEGGAGEHLFVGFYNGHDGTFEAPANPLLPDTLLIDTHPWELGRVYWGMTERSTSPLLGPGWITDIPGYDSLPVDDEEFGGHGYFTIEGTTVNAALELVSVTAGLEILKPDLTPMQPGDRLTLGTAPFGVHPTYFISDDSGLERYDVVTAVFRLVDTTGQMQTSETFEVKQVVGGLCNPADIAAPFGILNATDVNAFLSAFLDGNSLADLAAPEGFVNATDVNAFIASFLAGCP